MTKTERDLLRLSHGLYDTLLDLDICEIQGRSEDAETVRMQIEVLGRELYQHLRPKYETGA